MLEELHGSLMGIVKMKSLARSSFWWPSMDIDIENSANGSEIYLAHRPEPKKMKLTKWPETAKPFERIHLDFAGPINNSMYFILVDEYSK